ncbi:vWA domain-containing protein [Candidatus Uabimicrobium amorphum]|uniref:VWFA domain-containing protein n=1 Tax=Uabimicrobium amorphum TaxID=2596890 RepID=A0A5S9IK06_UABAM|nr:VWA domain-containing protein [Candidatus Uabimicrobium amorphum]BBM82947.1 hypothetical protein UABAM_01290 [Candidatus Uabimicrobium amorphum]
MNNFNKHLTQFFHYLKQQGLAVSIAEEIDACHAVMHIDILNRQTFYDALRTCVAKTYEHQQIFRQAFYEYWYSGVVRQEGLANSSSGEKGKGHSQKGEEATHQKSQKNGARMQSMFSYSPLHSIKHKQHFLPVADKSLQRTIEQIAWQLASSLDRNYRRSKNKRFDLRNTIRKNRKYHPDILHLHFCAKKKRKLKLIVLCDTSHSMKDYNYFFLQFIFAFARRYKEVKSFLFNTQLYDITPQTQQQNVRNVLLSVSQSGTRIGESLRAFFTKYRHLISKSTYIVIVSDGWDRGDVNLMEHSMEKLQHYSKGIIWLNPWSATPGFEPTTRCMKVAKPYIEVLSSVHDLDSLKKFSRLLCR